MDEHTREKTDLFRRIHYLCGALSEVAPFDFLHSKEYADAYAALVNLETSLLGGAYVEAEGGFHAAESAGRKAAKAYRKQARDWEK